MQSHRRTAAEADNHKHRLATDASHWRQAAKADYHEHQSPTEHLKWDKEAVYKAFSGPPNNWSKADIDHNILQKYSPHGISATRFDKSSIMLYQFDGSLFTNGKGTPLNYQLSGMDKRMIGEMYPIPADTRRTA